MTFVGKSFAKKGFRFYFSGPNSRCPKKCQFWATCQENLAPNKVYEIIEVKDRELKCPKDYHEEPMILVRVREASLEVSFESKNVFEGAITTYHPIKCDNETCAYYPFCMPSGYLIKDGSKVKILKRIEKIKKCSKNKALSLVKIQKSN